MKTKLDKIRDKYKNDIPPLPYLPIGEVILVYRIPSETHTAGGLEIPEEYRSPVSSGILLAAGLAALDVMKDSLIEIGDIVYFGRYEGDEREFKREEAQKGQQLLQLKIRGLLGSADALGRVNAYIVERDKETGEHIYKQRKAA